MEVRYTSWAEYCLKEIYNYYSEEAGSEKALEVINTILDRAETLCNNPDRGKIEDDLKSLGKGHRYVLEYHYKIIYKIEDETVIVTDIFSNYQKPSRKLRRNK